MPLAQRGSRAQVSLRRAPASRLRYSPMRRFIKNRTSAGDAAGGDKLNLRLSGFSRQALVPVDDIVRAIDRLPGFHLEGLREIVYLPEDAPAASGFFCPALPRGEPK